VIDYRWEGWQRVKLQLDHAMKLCADRVGRTVGRQVVAQVISGGNDSIPFHGSSAFRLRSSMETEGEIILTLSYTFDANRKNEFYVTAVLEVEEGLQLEDPQLASMPEIAFTEQSDEATISRIKESTSELELFIGAQVSIISRIFGERKNGQ
jgi:hypothetical protein